MLFCLESEVSKCTVSLCHAVHIFLTLLGTTLIIEGIHNLRCELVGHRLTTTLTGEGNKVLHRDTLLTAWANFCRNLESSTTDTAAFFLSLWGNVVVSPVPAFQRS